MNMNNLRQLKISLDLENMRKSTLHAKSKRGQVQMIETQEDKITS